jgi:hypothetical protein
MEGLLQLRSKRNTEIKLSKNEDECERLHALYIASTSALRIFKGEEAIELIYQSERTMQELKKMVETNGEYNQNAIIREFGNFDVENEFRAFIYNKKLTGITQYNNFCYFQNLQNTSKEIGEKIKRFVEEELVEKVKLSNFVIDVVMVGDEMNPMLIEINPFGEFCGAGN